MSRTHWSHATTSRAETGYSVLSQCSYYAKYGLLIVEILQCISPGHSLRIYSSLNCAFTRHLCLENALNAGNHVIKAQPQSELVGLHEVVVGHHAHDTSYLKNGIVKSLAWSGVNVIVPDRETKKPKQILTFVSGHVMSPTLSSGFKS